MICDLAKSYDRRSSHLKTVFGLFKKLNFITQIVALCYSRLINFRVHSELFFLFLNSSLLLEKMKITILLLITVVIAQLDQLGSYDGASRSYGSSSDDPLQETVQPIHRKWTHLGQIEDEKILIYWSDRVIYLNVEMSSLTV